MSERCNVIRYVDKRNSRSCEMRPSYKKKFGLSMASGSIKGKIEEQASEFEHVESERLLHWRLVLFFAVLHKCRAKHFYMEKNAASLERHVELERTLKRKIPDVPRKYLSSSVFSHRKNEYLFSPRCSAYMHTYILFYARKHAGQHVTRIFFFHICRRISGGTQK